MLAVAILLTSDRPLQGQTTRIGGVIKDASGQPVAGALVKIRNEELGLGFLVVSQQEGRYNTPNLLPGKYAIQAFGGTNQSALSNPIDIRDGKTGNMDLALSYPLVIAPREKRSTDEELEKLLPEGPGKKFAADQCTNCHSLLPVVSARKSRAQWQESYDRMLDDMYDMRKLMIYHQPTENSDLVLGYLAKNFGPDTPPDPRVMKEWLLRPGGPAHPNRNLPSKLLKGAAAKYVAMEFSLPAGATAHDIAVDSQGIAWVSERNTGMLGRFDPASLTYTRVAVPPGKNSSVQLDAITIDSQDQIWFADDGPNGRILRYEPKSKEFTSYLMPEYRFLVPPDIGWARIRTLRVSNGNVWAAGITSSRILKLDIASRKIIDYSVPKGSLPFGLAVGNNAVWYSSLNSSQVVKVDTRSGLLTKYYVPNIQEKERTDLRGLVADADGSLWVVATEKGKLLKLDPGNGHFTEFSPPTEDSGPYAIDVDTKKNVVWFSQAYTDRIARFDPRTSSFVEYSHPSADSDVRRIEVDRSHPNRVWWSGNRTGKIGYIETVE